MAKYFWVILLCSLPSASYCQQCLYTYVYKFAPLGKSKTVGFDSSGLRDEAYNIILKNASATGIMYNNGSLLIFDMDGTQKDTADMLAGKVSVSAAITDDAGKSYGFIAHDTAVDFNQRDTAYYFIDSSVTFIATGRKKTISQWKCREYKPDKEIYQCYSLWICDDVPRPVTIFPFKGITAGMVELDNNDKKMKVYLVSYKKSTSYTSYPITMKAPGGKIDFLANFNK